MAKKIYFNDVFELQTFLERHEKERPNANSVVFDIPNFCPFSWQESIDLLKNGWSEGIRELDNITNELELLDDENGGYNIEYDVTGDYIDIGAFVTGQPECMASIITDIGATKEIDLYVNISANANQSHETIIKRGGAVNALINKLQNDYIVNVWLVMKSTYKGGIESYIKLNTENEYSRDLLAFYIANPAMLRRFMFAVMEDTFNEDSCGTYGQTENIPAPKEKNTIYIPALDSSNKNLWQDNKTATQEINRIVKEFNNRMEKN